MEERRKFTRIKAKFAIDVVPTGEAEAQNISQAGLLFTHPEEVKLGTILELTLRVPGLTGSVSVKGKVSRCMKIENVDKYHVGIHFVDTDEETQKNVLEMLDSF